MTCSRSAGSSIIIFLMFRKSFDPPPSIMYEASVQGEPENPIRGTRPLSPRRVIAIASMTNRSCRSGSTGFSPLRSSADRRGVENRGPSPSTMVRCIPIASGTTSMSEKSIAASTPMISTGWIVTSEAISGVLHIVRKSWRARTARYSGR